ncbi:MAG: response regulator [Flavobacteriaceae bacterium]|nr:response regulator [Flavobacteriaceae bacterium]
MLDRVLLAEDKDDIHQGVYARLKEMGVKTIDQVQYFDDAYLKVQKALQDNQAYDLLITDLHFTKDHRKQILDSGEALIIALKEKQIHLPVLVYSADNRLERIRRLIHQYGIQAYACKDRHGLNDMEAAISAIVKGKTPYLSAKVDRARKPADNKDINDYDIQLLLLLSMGYTQAQISESFRQKNTKPFSLSSIEKRINRLKDIFEAKNAAHLVAIAKDSGLI